MIMKKTLITMMACVVLGAACGAAENTEKGFGLEVNAAYNFALKDIASDLALKVDTYGLDLTAVYRIDKHNSVNLRFGWATGDNDDNVWFSDVDLGAYSVNEKVEITNITIMPGYRYTTAVIDSMDFFWGINAGLVRTEAELTASLYGLASASMKKDEWNFAWSTEVGIAQKVSEHSKLTLALQLQGLYAQPSYNEDGEEYKPSSQLQLGVRVGYSCQF